MKLRPPLQPFEFRGPTSALQRGSGRKGRERTEVGYGLLRQNTSMKRAFGQPESSWPASGRLVSNTLRWLP